MNDVWAFMGSSERGNDDFELLESVPVVEGDIGSDESCALRLTDPMITPRHARLERVDGQWHLSQVAIASPTLVNDRVIDLGTRSRLEVGDVVQMGTARFRVGGEPPSRQGVDPRDASARLIWADQLAERGSSIGAQLLEGRAPDLALYGLDAAADGVTPEWLEGALIGAVFRECDLAVAGRLLAGPAGATIERIRIPIASHAGSEQDRARQVLQALAAIRPPRLRVLEFGWLHERTELRGAERDWKAIARRIPLEGSVHQAVRRAGRPRAMILRGSPWWPAVGTCLELESVGGPDEGRGWVTHDPEEPLMHQIGTESTRVHLFARAGGPAMIVGQKISINGSAARHGVLAHGDLVEGPHFAFRFEED